VWAKIHAEAQHDMSVNCRRMHPPFKSSTVNSTYSIAHG